MIVKKVPRLKTEGNYDRRWHFESTVNGTIGRFHDVYRWWQKWESIQLTERRMKKNKNTSESLLQRHNRKSFLQGIVTGEKKWISFENPKQIKSWIDRGQRAKSSVKRSRFSGKVILSLQMLNW